MLLNVALVHRELVAKSEGGIVSDQSYPQQHDMILVLCVRRLNHMVNDPLYQEGLAQVAPLNECSAQYQENKLFPVGPKQGVQQRLLQVQRFKFLKLGIERVLIVI